MRKFVFCMALVVAVTFSATVFAEEARSGKNKVGVAKKMMIEHFGAISKISQAHKDGSPLTKQELKDLEDLARKEGDLYLELQPNERSEVYNYAMGLFAVKSETKLNLTTSGVSPRERYLNAMEFLGIQTIRKEITDFSFMDCTDQKTNQNENKVHLTVGAQQPQCAMCIGFIVGHRRCCANNVGNGVCGGAPVDCFHYWNRMESESCPPSYSCYSNP